MEDAREDLNKSPRRLTKKDDWLCCSEATLAKLTRALAGLHGRDLLRSSLRDTETLGIHTLGFSVILIQFLDGSSEMKLRRLSEYLCKLSPTILPSSQSTF